MVDGPCWWLLSSRGTSFLFTMYQYLRSIANRVVGRYGMIAKLTEKGLVQRTKYPSELQKKSSLGFSVRRWKLSAVTSTLLFGILALSGTRWVIPRADMKGARDGNNFIADVVERTGKAVVMVEILSRNFFSGSMAPQSNGSGFIVREDGVIITSAHVVISAKHGGTVNVKLFDDTDFHGTIEALDMKADLAIIKIKPKQKLPTIPLGTDKDIRPGEWVIAIGSPLALANTITAGVVSTVHRHSHELKLVGKEDMSYIQTDASLTFGNSGGPLVNLDGEVIGVNAMKVAAGISFAVPIGHVKELIDHPTKKFGKSLINNPKWYIGVGMFTLTPHIIHELRSHHKIYGNSFSSGVLIWQVAPHSPAYHGGLHAGDIVIEMNGEKVSSTKHIYKALEFDEVLTMKVIRHGEVFTVSVKPEVMDL